MVMFAMGTFSAFTHTLQCFKLRVCSVLQRFKSTSTMTAGVPPSIAVLTVFSVPTPPSKTTHTEGMIVPILRQILPLVYSIN